MLSRRLNTNRPGVRRARELPPPQADGRERNHVHIGPHRFAGRFFLAPLAGVSDRPFRKICRDMGAAFAYTEMVSAHGLLHETRQTLSYLDRDPEEVPFAVQIFAAEPDALARGAEAAVRHGAGLVDINMACPVKKVCGTGAGASLARDPAAVEAAVRAVREAGGVPVSVKIRAGWDDANLNCVEVARAAEAGGASAVALHGRTRAQGYAGQARWEFVAAVKRAVSIPVLGSGDVWTAADALRMRAETGCDAVLVARGACGNPWIFSELRAAERGEAPPPPPTRGAWAEVVLRHVALQIEHRRRQLPAEAADAAERHALRELRKHLLWYTRGRRGGLHFRRDADRLETADDVRRLIDLHFPDDGEAFAPAAAAEGAAGEELH
ncbi:tRNA dihydrouridine synthase DusB [Anaeromyxobacter diazotrophicus]|uniref:tRNA-dihydrouridine synthase n=1 Tax=Anaeromyxobacter diazotrophicus TaxID=2590199 RepID=A0A7I9VK34_9BACT|nr:tRNA dihydrouridine synthase DusB [Anaeromyxobacter diazotrophicus]GEJ56743.1 tRNA-dihydrouridine synthase [Anaeromyxobacter diazotrophicus]